LQKGAAPAAAARRTRRRRIRAGLRSPAVADLTTRTHITGLCQSKCLYKAGDLLLPGLRLDHGVWHCGALHLLRARVAGRCPAALALALALALGHGLLGHLLYELPRERRRQASARALSRVSALLQTLGVHWHGHTTQKQGSFCLGCSTTSHTTWYLRLTHILHTAIRLLARALPRGLASRTLWAHIHFGE
jgi:hypothetical protein